jgi:hypothetical protein
LAGGIDFNRGKFKELVVFFAAASANDEGFGMVKLNKLLYRADFEAFRLLGQSMTGETYEKQDYGPVARDLPIVLDDLAADGRLYWQLIPRGKYTRKVPTPSGDPDAVADMSTFSEGEREVLAKTIAELLPHGGRGSRDWSHKQSAGWNVVSEHGQPIDYGTAFISTRGIPPQDLERARHYVRERGWVKSAAN